MSPFIEHATLAEGFNKAIPFIKSIGMEMEVACVGHGVGGQWRPLGV